MKKHLTFFAIALAVVTLFASCDRNKVYEEFVEIEDYAWNMNQPLSYEFEITDTTALHDIYINVRHANQYQYNNLWLFINSWSPSGQKAVDTVECVLADEHGKWQGSGLGDIWDTQILWKKNVRFATAGKYHVEYNQAMRTDNLIGIMDMGLRIELADNEE
ncbi:MAG: gliding motility lipoprotein GldH [Bacteroidales bacterium]|jgi:gliding motility-associated lipoprotein GldH|nr:gliding motility lipoprotein GldH [Bacteroidales bacterium]